MLRKNMHSGEYHFLCLKKKRLVTGLNVVRSHREAVEMFT